MTQEEFDLQFRETLDALITAMAENAEVDLQNFYSLTLYLENLSYFSPFIWGLLEQSKKK